MKSSCLLNDLASRSQIEMEGICENEVDRLYFISDVLFVLEEVKDHPFDRSFSSNGHKNWGFYLDTVECYFSGSGIPFLFQYFKVKFSHLVFSMIKSLVYIMIFLLKSKVLANKYRLKFRFFLVDDLDFNDLEIH